MKKLFFIVSTVFLVGVILLFWFHYHINKEPEVKDQLLSKNDIDTINSYKAKYQSFIVPSDAEVLNVAKILLSSNLTTDKVEKLLGKPRQISERPSTDIKNKWAKSWGYDIGYSRRMEIRFDSNDRLISIRGIGIGFDELTLPPKK